MRQSNRFIKTISLCLQVTASLNQLIIALFFIVDALRQMIVSVSVTLQTLFAITFTLLD